MIFFFCFCFCFLNKKCWKPGFPGNACFQTRILSGQFFQDPLLGFLCVCRSSNWNLIVHSQQLRLAAVWLEILDTFTAHMHHGCITPRSVNPMFSGQIGEIVHACSIEVCVPGRLQCQIYYPWAHTFIQECLETLLRSMTSDRHLRLENYISDTKNYIC